MKKNIIAAAVLAAAAVLIALNVKIQSPEEYYLEHIEDITSGSKVVTLGISCKTVLDNYDKLDGSVKKYIPEDGIILEDTKYVLRPKDTAYSVLERAVRHNKIQFEHSGDTYVEGINYLYEFSCGERSGWLYKVNGKYPNVSAAEYYLSENDKIEWVYSCELGDYAGNGEFE